MPGIIKKLKAANKKRKVKKAIKRADKSGKTAASAAYLKNIVSRTTDPVKSGSSGSGSITKTTTRQKVEGALQKPYSTRVKKALQSQNKAVKKGVDAVMGYSKGGMMKKSSYSKGGYIQHD
tara:strand:- start:1478 stop:1840 length:363 start_codon:yes stop_codon:yes gene_type:complete